MNRKLRRRRAKIRCKAVKRWIAGRRKNDLSHPTDEMIESFEIGVNMGWRARDDEIIGYRRWSNGIATNS